MKSYWIGFTAAVFVLTVTTGVRAGNIFDSGLLNDYYVGGLVDPAVIASDAAPYDIIGEAGAYSVESSRLTLDGTSVADVTGELTVHTTNVNYQGFDGIDYGAVFFTDQHNPNGGGQAIVDPNNEGLFYGLYDTAESTPLHTDWKYAFTLNYAGGDPTATTGTLDLWEIDYANQGNAILTSDEALPPGTPLEWYREKQAVDVDQSHTANTLVKANAGTWTATAATSSSGTYGAYYDAGTLTFSDLDLAATGLITATGGELAWHWTMSCGNDVVEQSVLLSEPFGGAPPPPPPAPIPEPASILVFSSLTGLGLLSVRRRRRTSEMQASS